LWFTESAANNIGRITTAGAITEYPIPTPNSAASSIATGPDGALWFTEGGANQIGRITTAGAITEYAGAGGPAGIAAGPDGALWFTTITNIGRITTSGVITEYPTPNMFGNFPITAGSDGALWFAASGYVSTMIGRAPACGLGFSANFANGTLTMNFNMGIDTPATFNILLKNAAGDPVGEPFSKAISPVVPPRAFTMNWNPFPNQGSVIVQPTLTAGPGQALCSEWTAVNTAQ
jgi:virginiamycin B lyase